MRSNVWGSSKKTKHIHTLTHKMKNEKNKPLCVRRYISKKRHIKLELNGNIRTTLMPRQRENTETRGEEKKNKHRTSDDRIDEYKKKQEERPNSRQK